MKFWKNLRQGDPKPQVQAIQLQSVALQRDVKIDLYLPAGYEQAVGQEFSLLIFNDGQDLPRMQFSGILEKYYQHHEAPPMIVAGVYTSDARIREYGTGRQADYKGRGDLAGIYTRFLVDELLPYLNRHYPLSDLPEHRAIAGFSLGGLSAFDIGWARPDLFGVIGVFSGSFWWRWSAVRPEDPDADRIMHDIIRNTAAVPSGQRYWFQCGTLDETDDRNGNGIIDSIDDTNDLIRALHDKNIPESAIKYLEIAGGRHEPHTWGEAMPDFLRWFTRV